MSEKALKIVPAPESKTSPETKTETPGAKGLFARIGRKRLRTILLVGLPAVVLVIGLAFYFSGGRYISTDNAYVGAQKVLITPDISGKIVSVAIREGQHVNPGEELFSLDREPFALALAQAKAKLDTAHSDFDKLKTNLKSLGTLAELADKNVELKQHDVDRKTKLVSTQAGSQADLDTAMAGMVTAKLQAELAVQQRDANPKETDITYLRVGQKATIDVDSFPDRTFAGSVVSVSPGTGAQFSILPPQNATGNWVKVVQRVPVRIAFDKSDDTKLLRSGMSVNVEIDTGHSRLPFMSAQAHEAK